MQQAGPGALRVVTTVAVAAVVLAGCTSATSGHGSTSTDSQRSSSPTGAAAPGSSSSASATTFASVLLRATDLPAGWTPQAHDPSGDNNDDQSLDKQLSRCIGVSIPTPAESGDADAVHSPDFHSGDNEITSEARPAHDVAAQKRFNRAVIASPKTDGCFEAVLRSGFATSLPAGAKLGSVTVRVSGRAAGQPANVEVNFSARIQVTVQGRTVVVALDFVDILGTKVDAEIDFQGLNAPIPAATQSAAVSAVAGRVAKA